MPATDTESYLDLFGRPRFFDKGLNRPKGRALVPVLRHPTPAPIEVRVRPEDVGLRNGELHEIKASDGVDVRDISPRSMVGLGLDLYVTGALSYDEYAMLAFQPELHPNYDTTIGALLGETAAPDRKRDFIRIWEDRYEFEIHYNGDDRTAVRQTKRILDVLRALDQTVVCRRPAA